MKVGSLVIRTEDHESLNVLFRRGNVIPDKESIYTVRDIEAGQAGVKIRLEEIVNPTMRYAQGVGECFFLAKLFKEIQSPDEINVSELMEETNLIPFFVGNGY